MPSIRILVQVQGRAVVQVQGRAPSAWRGISEGGGTLVATGMEWCILWTE